MAPAHAQPAPAAIAADPTPDSHAPAGLYSFALPTHGVRINAVLLTAAGAGPHPTVLLLHGFPGNEQNLHLAQAIRRDGWNVLTLHYRGARLVAQPRDAGGQEGRRAPHRRDRPQHGRLGRGLRGGA